jgi:hypothetical protein
MTVAARRRAARRRARAPGQPGPGYGSAGQQQKFSSLNRHLQNSTHPWPVPPLELQEGGALVTPVR